MFSLSSSPRALALAGCAACLLSACGPRGLAPQIGNMSDQTVAVGEELVVVVSGTDPEGDFLLFGFSAAQPLQSRATLTPRPDGTAEFRFRPVAEDIGFHLVDFSVSDRVHVSTTTVGIEVRSASTKDSVPSFVAPLGSGTTINLESASCVGLDVVVVDYDSTDVDIFQQDPPIRGATLEPIGPMAARWSWCPSDEQIAEASRYTLALVADDGQNEPVIKHYLIVLRAPPDPSCQGDPPVVAHSPSDETTSADISITAQISDDIGLSDPPLLYYSSEPPGDPIELGAMIQVTMSLQSGDMEAGTWVATVPNPVASGSAGDLHYVIVADDQDQADCRRSTTFPETGGHFAATITNPAAPACSDDASESDDDELSARTTSFPFASATNQICSGDDDWFFVELSTGETLTVDLTFSNASGDLDLHLLDAALTDLTPCSEADPSGCSDAQGQSVTDNEQLVAFNDEAGCAPCGFFVVVHGWNGAENSYDIAIDAQ